jgi:hypothetical protein
MIGFMEMKNGDLRRHPTGFDQIGILQGASGAETGWTDISTSIAFDALPELPHPILKSFFLRKLLDLIDV